MPKKLKRYKYPNSDKVFELLKRGPYGNYIFKCGHRCTDNVFEDLIDLDTGIAEWQKPKQLTFNF